MHYLAACHGAQLLEKSRSTVSVEICPLLCEKFHSETLAMGELL